MFLNFCHPDKDVRKKGHKLLIESGVIVQRRDNKLKAISPEEADMRLEQMKPENRAFYKEI